MARETDVKLYDPKKVQLIVAGMVMTGVDDGDFIKVSRNEDRFALKVGAYGGAVRTTNNNTSGKLTFRLLQTSPGVGKIRQLQKQHNAFAVVCIDNNPEGDNGFAMANAWVVKPPDFVRNNKDESVMEVTIETNNLIFN